MIAVVAILAHWLYSTDCCADRDCHPVPCEEIVDTAWGWIWTPVGHSPVTFNREHVKPSPDGRCHVCHLGYGPGMNGICIYLPARV
jgi:hypothetical protein